MSAPRVLVTIVVLVVILALGWWVTRHRPGRTPPAEPIQQALPNLSPTVPVPAPLQAPRGYRLAGVAVGDPASFAVIESPNGSNALYRVNADIPGLGRLVHIEAERAVVQNDAGLIELWLAPAASPTPTRVRAATARAATAATRAASPRLGATPTPTPPPAGGVSAP